MSDVLYRATKYMDMEDTLLGCEEKPRKREIQEESRQDRGRKIVRTGYKREDRRSKPPTEGFASFTPLNTPIDQVLMQIKDEGALTFLGKLKETLARGPETNTIVSTATMVMTHLTAMT